MGEDRVTASPFREGGVSEMRILGSSDEGVKIVYGELERVLDRLIDLETERLKLRGLAAQYCRCSENIPESVLQQIARLLQF